MGFKLRNIAAAIAAVSALAAGSAQAALNVNNWTLNLSGIDGLPVGTIIQGIDQIAFTGIAGGNPRTQTTVGGTQRVTGLLAATQLLDGGAAILNNGGLNQNGGYELTFKFDVVNEVTAYSVGVDALGNPYQNSQFTHLSAADSQALGATGLLEIYIDAFGNGGDQAKQDTGAGYTDGLRIARFAVRAGKGGNFNFLTGNGTDDAIFDWIDGVSGVILDASGKDLANNALVAVTASQFDIDQNNDGTLDVTCPTNGSLGTPGAVGCAQEDGRASLQQEVPEPATLALTGLALAGLGLARRRSARK